MAKSKRTRAKGRQGSSIDWGGGAAKGTGRVNLVLGAIAVLAIASLGAWWWHGRSVEMAFHALVETGRAALALTQTHPNHGRGHLQPGEHHSYDTAFPTSGTHSLTWVKPGVYDKPQPPTMLVHALEHGNIVIYYDTPAPEAMDRLKDWAGLYTGQWDGVILTPGAGLGEGIVLTAWRKSLTQESFDAAAAAAFIDEFRGRGPENPVR